jgi:hypothetical protein
MSLCTTEPHTIGACGESDGQRNACEEIGSNAYLQIGPIIRPVPHAKVIITRAILWDGEALIAGWSCGSERMMPN